MADKTKNPKKITRFITLFPVIIGFGLTVLFRFVKNGEVCFNDGFYNVWLSSVSLSLAMYAFWEKFVPSEKKILSEAEINANKAAVEKLKGKLVSTQPAEDNQSTETDENVSASHKKIIISNSKNIK